MANAISPFQSHVPFQIDPMVHDNITNSAPCLDWMLEGSRVKTLDGNKLYINILPSLPTVENYTATQTTAISNVVQSDTNKAATYDIDGRYVVGYGTTQDDEDKGESPAAVLKTSFVKEDQAAKAITETVADDVFDGTGSANTMFGLDTVISATSSQEVGLIDTDEIAAWTPTTSSTATILNQLADINAQIEAASNGAEKPNKSFTTEALYGRLLDIVGERNQLVNASGTAKLGFDSVVYRGVDFVKDRHATTNYLYILNGNTVGLLVARNKVFANTGLKENPLGYLTKSGMFLLRGSVWCSSRRANGGFSSLTVS